MLNTKSNNTSKKIVDDQSCLPISKRLTASSFLDIYVGLSLNVGMIRAAGLLKKAVPLGSSFTIQTGLKLFYPIPNKKYFKTSTSGFNLEIDENGALKITPFGEAMSAGDSVLFSETFILDELSGGGIKTLLYYLRRFVLA